MRFVKDPCGIVCLVITYAIISYADYVVMRWIILHYLETSLWAPVHVVLFNTIVFLLIMSHLKAVFSDPGTVPLPANRLDFSDMYTVGKNPGNSNGNGGNGGMDNEIVVTGNARTEWTVCSRCEIYRPPRAHHCRICKRCIRRMDHHCPWINNCVGERNQKYFLQFLIYVGFMSVYAAILVLYTWMTPCENCNFDNFVVQNALLHSVLLLIVSGLFGIFVVAIMVDQMHAILYDETAIEQAQGSSKGGGGGYRPNRRKLYLLADVFGRGHPLCWLLPCSNITSSPSLLRYHHDTPLLSHEV